MIPFMKKYYKLAPNGKLELFGKDGYEHAFISMCVMGVAPVVTYILRGLFWGMVAAIITYIIMRVVWWVIEYEQEEDMLDEDPKRVKVPWTNWSPARMVDMKYALIVDTPILLVWVIAWYVKH